MPSQFKSEIITQVKSQVIQVKSLVIWVTSHPSQFSANKFQPSLKSANTSLKSLELQVEPYLLFQGMSKFLSCHKQIAIQDASLLDL